MTRIRHHMLPGFGILLLFAFVIAAVLLSWPVLFFVPAVVAGGLLFLHYPRLLFYTLLFSIPWSVEVTFTNGLGTDLPDEPLMLLLAFVTIALVLVRGKTALLFNPLHPLLLMLFAGLAWTAVTVVASTYFSFSFKYFLAKGWYILAFVGAPLLLKGDEKLVKNSALILFVSMFLVTCVGLVRHGLLHFTFASVNDAISPFFRNHVNYSALLVFMLPLQVVFLRLTKNKMQRKVILLTMMIVAAALYLSFARGAWLAMLAGLTGYWLLRKKWLFKSFLLFVLLTAGTVFYLQQNNRFLAFSPRYESTVFHENFAEHLVATYKGKDVSTAERFHRWIAGARMAGENRVTGFGPTTFYQHYKSYTVPLFRTWVSDNREQSTVHNYFLLLLVEQGIAGLLLFLLLLGFMFRYAQKIFHRTGDVFWKLSVAAIASILCMQVVLNFLSDLVETDKVGSVFYLCIAILIIADKKTRTTDDIK